MFVSCWCITVLALVLVGFKDALARPNSWPILKGKDSLGDVNEKSTRDGQIMAMPNNTSNPEKDSDLTDDAWVLLPPSRLDDSGFKASTVETSTTGRQSKNKSRKDVPPRAMHVGDTTNMLGLSPASFNHRLLREPMLPTPTSYRRQAEVGLAGSVSHRKLFSTFPDEPATYADRQKALEKSPSRLLKQLMPKIDTSTAASNILPMWGARRTNEGLHRPLPPPPILKDPGLRRPKVSIMMPVGHRRKPLLVLPPAARLTETKFEAMPYLRRGNHFGVVGESAGNFETKFGFATFPLYGQRGAQASKPPASNLKSTATKNKVMRKRGRVRK